MEDPSIRLYNLIFEQNDGVIPFYYEVREWKRWAVEFCKEFFLTFIYQYIAYKTRKPEYIAPHDTIMHNPYVRQFKRNDSYGKCP